MRPQQRRSVLIVEDDRKLRELYRSALRNAGFEVAAVEDGTDALYRIEDWTPDVVVLDLALPRLGGRDLLRELKARRATRGIPVIIVTGTDASDLQPGPSTRILQKPIDTDVLLRVIDEAILSIRSRPEST